MNILIDNKDLEGIYDIKVLNYSGALDFASERENEKVWADKSGVDKNLENIRYNTKEFILSCYVKAGNIENAYEKVAILVDYMFTKGVFVLSLRDTSKSIRKAFLCERSKTIVSNVNIRQQNSLYVFKLGLKDVNPNAVHYETVILGNSVTINYTKGQTAVLYWGNGDRDLISNSGDYSKIDYAINEDIDIFVDVDSNAPTVLPLEAIFFADITSGVKQQEVNFTDNSTGNIIIWSWDFGDGNTSEEQSPIHTYQEAGIYTVTLQIFNDVQGFDVEEKVDYITVRNANLQIDGTDLLLINGTDLLLKN